MPISKVVRVALKPRYRSACFVLRCASKSTGACGSHSGENQGGQPRLPGPSSGGSDNPGGQTIYDARKIGHKLSTDSTAPNFETLSDIPSGIFRCTTGEVLGRGAGKCTYYQNPEYFSYHHMSFYDLNLSLKLYRSKPCPVTGRKPN